MTEEGILEENNEKKKRIQEATYKAYVVVFVCWIEIVVHINCFLVLETLPDITNLPNLRYVTKYVT